VLWESTAVSEIRVHAPWIAERLLALAPPRLVSSLPSVS